ncbi:MAG: DNA-directed RNA polymerase subunit alpha [Candidatus Omnitrophica bacterium CG11_big_fil_rev_8_21_14_0_20_45_26]|uniref:DNA-directed RNA polymerase subunit alpha n=1 Tax=Candidatus Abzuiibacterium crystallinum TaxID=1974748 RepID=A0A2H0LN64_9BACT|nr:MAG: DNA-directed RNA polymerase subunit alpha [Candidatus Omnitrophica bacterium CG11_big_fil_rev_8_21_14_0_20_45_26]PIW65083.1 MAG: DNA-directed RNA polymerase subunit alpha [Candidatus Omnitrophica bacterium CG12_big_fil_rev_8_21_14_0_65_45_16]
MGIRWKTFEVPKRLEVDKETLTPTFGKFVAEPFERGYGATIGNAMRRVLISSIDGAAVTCIRMNGVLHEFSAIDGVLEDVAQIVLNVKKLVLRYHGKETKTITIDIKKEGVVTARDIMADETIEIINPDHKICTLTKEMPFRMEMDVARGRGYVPAERNKKEGSPIGSVAVDSIFSPVIRVNFAVEETRVGQTTDYDRLLLEVTTNGAMSPEEAMLYASNILQRHLDIFVNYGELPEEEEEEEEEDKEFLDVINKPITELELSVRSANCLEAANIKTIGELIQKTEAQMLKYKNFGKKSLQEISSILTGMNLHLGMDLQAKLKKKEAVS